MLSPVTTVLQKRQLRVEQTDLQSPPVHGFPAKLRQTPVMAHVQVRQQHPAQFAALQAF